MAAVAIEDMRSVEPVAYIRATGLRPEDSYGFLPLDLSDFTSYFFLYRERPEYEKTRTALPGAESAGGFDPTGMSSNRSLDNSLEDLPAGMAGGLTDMIAQAQQMQQQWAGQGVAGGPDEPPTERIARLEKLKEMGAINESEYKDLVSEVQGGDAGPSPGGAPAASAAKDAPEIVVHRIYPGMRMRTSMKQLDGFMPAYRDALQLCPEDVYGPSTRRGARGGRRR